MVYYKESRWLRKFYYNDNINYYGMFFRRCLFLWRKLNEKSIDKALVIYKDLKFQNRLNIFVHWKWPAFSDLIKLLTEETFQPTKHSLEDVFTAMVLKNKCQVFETILLDLQISLKNVTLESERNWLEYVV